MPHHVILETLQGNFAKLRADGNKNGKTENKHLVYCKLHDRYYVNYPKSVFSNIFVINIENLA
jgi:hypothetical protein